MRRVVVTGLGAVTPLGVGAQRSWTRLVAGKSGLVSTRTLGPSFNQQQCQVAGLVPIGRKEDGGWQPSDWLTKDEERKMSKYMQYAMAATQEALDDAGWQPEEEHQKEMTGVCLGSGIGSFEEVYNTSLAFSQKGGAKKVSPYFVPKLLINLAAGLVSIRYGFQGPSHAVTTACTTGAHSIGDASRFIAFGDADVMVAGSAESCIHPLAFTGFERSRSLTVDFNANPMEASRPWDAKRSGFVIGEGAGVMVLEALDHALARKAYIYAELAGYGSSSDAHHMTAPPASGHGAFRAMRLALRNAGLAPRAVSYINAHATSTQLGDVAETRAIEALMLEQAGQAGGTLAGEGKTHAQEINVSSTKGAVGHLLGAAGSVEAIWSVLAMRDNILPPTLNLELVDEQIKQNCNYVPLKAQSEQDVDVVLTNSFGFGDVRSIGLSDWVVVQDEQPKPQPTPASFIEVTTFTSEERCEVGIIQSFHNLIFHSEDSGISAKLDANEARRGSCRSLGSDHCIHLPASLSILNLTSTDLVSSTTSHVRKTAMDANGRSGTTLATGSPAVDFLGRFPPELPGLVLGLLSTKEIKNLRLTSREYHNASSHLLIKKAYFALRPKTLAIFNEIIVHPIFSQSVAEIIYDTSPFVEPRGASPEEPFSLKRHIPYGDHSKEVMDAAECEYGSLLFEQQRIIDDHEDIKALRQASQNLVNLSSIVYTDWMVLENLHAFPATRLADISSRCTWYLRDGPMSWDVKEGCLPLTLQVDCNRYISQMARIISGHDGPGPTIRAFVFKVKDIVNDILTELLQQLPSSNDPPFDRTFMLNLYEINIGVAVRENELPLLNRLSDLLAQAEQLRSLILDIDQRDDPSELVGEWFFISRNYWPGLQTLKLRGHWRIDARSLLDFLGRHSRTLGDLLLSDVYLLETSKETWVDVALEIQILLPQLTSVQLHKLSEWDDNYREHLVEVYDDEVGRTGSPIKETDCEYRRKHLELLQRWILEAATLMCTERKELKQEVESLRNPYGWTCWQMMGTLYTDSDTDDNYIHGSYCDRDYFSTGSSDDDSGEEPNE